MSDLEYDAEELALERMSRRQASVVSCKNLNEGGLPSTKPRGLSSVRLEGFAKVVKV